MDEETAQGNLTQCTYRIQLGMVKKVNREKVVHARLDVETERRLRKLAEMDRRSMSDYLRILIEDHVKSKK